jgi:glutaconate CoA-transferase subunit B
VERVDFVTSPGYLTGGESRERAGLIFGRIGAVVTDLAVMDFEPVSRRMRLRALQPGVTAEQVQRQTGFELLADGHAGEIPPPSADELAVYRALRDGLPEPAPSAPATGRPT